LRLLQNKLNVPLTCKHGSFSIPSIDTASPDAQMEQTMNDSTAATTIWLQASALTLVHQMIEVPA